MAARILDGAYKKTRQQRGQIAADTRIGAERTKRVVGQARSGLAGS
jgi:hypothetical protein